MSTLTNFLELPQKYKKQQNISKFDYHAVFDISTYRIVSVSRNISSVKKINDSILNTGLFLFLNNYSLPADFNNLAPYCSQVNDPYGQSSISSSTTVLNDDDLEYYALITEKGFALEYLLNTIANHRRRQYSSTILQYEVYAMKHQEAQRVLSTGATELDELNYPFVTDYAQLENLSLVESAKEISFQHNLFYTKMSTIESMRLRYSKQIIECDNITQIPAIVADFLNRSRLYAIS